MASVGECWKSSIIDINSMYFIGFAETCQIVVSRRSPWIQTTSSWKIFLIRCWKGAGSNRPPVSGGSRLSMNTWVWVLSIWQDPKVDLFFITKDATDECGRWPLDVSHWLGVMHHWFGVMHTWPNDERSWLFNHHRTIETFLDLYILPWHCTPGLEYQLEKQAEPGVVVDLEKPLSAMSTHDFCLVRENSK